MIFTIGLVVAIVFWTLGKATAPVLFEEPPEIHYIFSLLFLVGILTMVISLCMLAWRYLP